DQFYTLAHAEYRRSAPVNRPRQLDDRAEVAYEPTSCALMRLDTWGAALMHDRSLFTILALLLFPWGSRVLCKRQLLVLRAEPIHPTKSLWVFSVALGVMIGGAGVASALDVPLWDRFEASVKNSRTYANPFTDVTLKTTFTRPDGSNIDFWGFYDGDGLG